MLFYLFSFMHNFYVTTSLFRECMYLVSFAKDTVLSIKENFQSIILKYTIMLSVSIPFYCTCDMHTHFHRLTQPITRGYRGENGMGRLIEEVYKIIQETTQENKTAVTTNENRHLVDWLVFVTCFTGVPGR